MSKDEITQAEKRQVLANDRRASLHDHATAQVNDSLGGRFAKAVHQTSVTGTMPIAAPPRISESSPWARGVDPSGQEPPLGLDVNYVEPIEQPKAVELVPSQSPAQDGPSEAPATPTVEDRRDQSIRKRRRL